MAVICCSLYITVKTVHRLADSPWQMKNALALLKQGSVVVVMCYFRTFFTDVVFILGA